MLRVVLPVLLLVTVAVGYENVDHDPSVTPPTRPPALQGSSPWLQPDLAPDKHFFLNALLDRYGDGVLVTKAQVQQMLDAVRRQGGLELVTKETDGLHGNISVCEDWQTDQECLKHKCLSADDIFTYHGVEGSAINSTTLAELSPTLLYAAQNGDCDTGADDVVKPNPSEVWGYSFLCVTVINLCSLMGMVFLPLMHKAFYQRFLMFMVALAVGTLSGSALLFLLPECFDFMNESNPAYHDYVWKCTTVIAGIYMFFLVERLLKIIMDWRKKLVAFDSDESSIDHVSVKKLYEPLKHAGEDANLENGPISSLKTRAVHRDQSMNMSFTVPHSPKSPKSRLSYGQKLADNTQETLVMNDTPPGDISAQLGAHNESQRDVKFDLPEDSDSSATNSDTTPTTDTAPREDPPAPQAQGLTPNDSYSYLRPNNSQSRLLDKRFPHPLIIHGQDESDTPPATPSEVSSKGDIKSVAWMVIFGDGLHNFIDGLSIGAAFSKNILAGVSVSVAVVCEELPHELGDFAVLLNSGMSMRQALSYNFLSACMCYLGLILGIVVGEMTHGSSWIFALAAGMFLYISLVDMLPEVNHAAETEQKERGSSWPAFFIQNAGLLTGYAIMLIMANFSDQITFEGH